MEEDIKIQIGEENEIIFNISVHGSNSQVESKFTVIDSGVMFSFPGENITSDEVSVKIPSTFSALSEGIYDAKLEIIVDNRYFSPLKCKVGFEEPLKVFAEVVSKQVPILSNTSKRVIEASIATKKPTTMSFRPAKKSRKTAETFTKKTLMDSLQKLMD